MSGNSKGNRESELEVFNRFSRIVRERFTSLADGGDGDDGGGGDGRDRIDRIDSLYKRPEFSAEKRILNDLNNMGLHKGVLSGVACFAFLRLSPRAISRMLQRRAAARAGTAASWRRRTTRSVDRRRVTSSIRQPPPSGSGRMAMDGRDFSSESCGCRWIRSSRSASGRTRRCTSSTRTR